jgi:UDP-2-acetamido-2,6-beta-L-arabino-hexul-4-ose reductase
LILITGANGFIGTNLRKKLDKENKAYICFNKDDKLSNINFKSINFVIHLAAVHRSDNEEDFKKYNIDYTEDLLNNITKYNIPIIYTSSVQSELNTAYGKSKKHCEELIKNYNKTNKYSKIFKLTNTFGKFGKPNHLSVVSTFCYNISHDKPIIISDENKIITLTYIDDVINSIYSQIKYNEVSELITVKPQFEISLKDLSEIIYKINNKDNINKNLLYFYLKETYEYYKDLP